MDPATTFQQGLALHQQGQLDKAEALYRAVISEQPAHFGALHLTGLVHYQSGAYAAAAEWIGRAIAVNPMAPEPHSNLGLTLLELRRPEEALASFDLSLKLKPDVPASLINRGNALSALERLDEALADYDRALAVQPNFILAHNNRGNTLRALGRPEEALRAYDNALKFVPDYPDALNNRGRTLHELKRYDEAAQSFARLIAVAPQQPYGPGMQLASRLSACDWTNYDASSSAIVAAVERGERADAPFSFCAHAVSPKAQLDCARLFVAAEYPTGATPLVTGPLPRHERIRIAYVSADFREHATAYLMAELFETHDRNRFEITGISYGPDDTSPMRARLEAAFDHFVDASNIGDQAVAELMRDRGIDIAVDLKGYSSGNRLGIFAFRGAPLQVAYIGFPATTGAPFIDYLIADKHIVPPELEADYSEKIARLPDSYQVNDRKRRIADRTPSRTDMGLPEKGFVFCSFNNSYKISPAVFDVWMKLLREVDGSVLWLFEDNEAAAVRLKAAAEARGISASRLIFAPRLPLDQHLARHRLADLFLDTFPVNAHASASDALWAGLPLVTLQGRTFTSRVASSLLAAVGLPELVTHTLEEYEALALKLARNPAEIARLKAHLEKARMTAPLFDTDRFRRNIENAFVTMYERSQKGEPPVSFDIA